ncbi:hypothetical protein F4677DRAFT_443610 [Hypoxylon crocopeplum]|nr:hypothetical protein F4677DRAFT_443610 [Hypoxylon crocopeplum]
MCQYVQVTYRCGHTELLAGPNCQTMLAELFRIYAASSWTSEGLQSVPFALPEFCLPDDGNMCRVSSGAFCGWECRNSCPDLVMEGEEGVTGGEGGMAQSGTYVEDAGRMPWYFGYNNNNNGGGAAADGNSAQLQSAGAQENTGGGGAGMGASTNAEGGTGKAPTRMGMPDAQYGVPRIGVGWRDDRREEITILGNWQEDGSVFD